MQLSGTFQANQSRRAASALLDLNQLRRPFLSYASMDTKLFGPKRKNVNLGGTAGQQQGTINEARQARERRERARLEAQAAVTLQSAYRGFRSRNTIKNANSEAFDQTTLNTENLVIATQLLLGGQPDLSRYASWCRFVVSTKSVFVPFQENEQQWTILLQRVGHQLLQLAARHPAAPQATLFLEVVRMMLDPKKYPESFKGAVQKIALYLVSQGLYRMLSTHLKAIVSPISSTSQNMVPFAYMSLFAGSRHLCKGSVDTLSSQRVALASISIRSPPF